MIYLVYLSLEYLFFGYIAFLIVYPFFLNFSFIKRIWLELQILLFINQYYFKIKSYEQYYLFMNNFLS